MIDKLIKGVKTAIGWMLAGVGFLLVLWSLACFKHGKPMEGAIAGAIVVIPLMIWFLVDRAKYKKRGYERIEWLKSKGQRIEVNYALCQVEESASSTVNYERMDVPVYTLDTRLHRPNSIGSPLIPEQNTRSQFDNAISENCFPTSITNVPRTTIVYQRCHSQRPSTENVPHSAATPYLWIR